MSRIKPVRSCQQEHGADAAGGEALDALGQFVVDVAGGDHGLIAFRSGPILDAVEDPPPAFAEDPAVAFSGLLAVAFSGLLGESSSHSKASVAWNSEDVFPPLLFQNLRGFSSFSRVLTASSIYHAWLRARTVTCASVDLGNDVPQVDAAKFFIDSNLHRETTMNAWGLNVQRAMLNSGSVVNILDEARKRAPKDRRKLISTPGRSPFS